MSNHITAKFLGFVYAPIPPDIFTEKLSMLSEKLRKLLPRYDTPSVDGIRINFNDGLVSTHREQHSKMLYMVDAGGVWGVKISDQGMSFSVSRYISYEEAIPYVKSILDVVVEALGITHFSRVILRNINLFDEVPDTPNRFEDIKDDAYWGRQNFGTLERGFLCNGASTRHEYFSNDHLTQVQLASGIVLTGQSPIPQNEWDIWKLRGGVPIQNKGTAQLLVDISGIKFQAPFNIPEKQNNVSEYSWEAVKTSFDELHQIINSVYSDITEE